MAEKPQCACLTKQNQRCKKPPMQNKPFCYLHQGCDHPYSVQPVPVPVPVPVQVQVRPQITLKQMVTQPKNKPQHLETLPQGAIFEPLCYNLANQQRYGDLYRLMHTNHQIEKKCRPYLDQLIEQLKKRNPNDLLYEACEQHDKALYDLAIQLEATDWNEGLLGASIGGHLDLVKLMIEKGADNLDRALDYANEEHLEIYKYLIDHGVDGLNYALDTAAYSGSLEMVKYFIEKGAKFVNNAIELAGQGGHLDVIEYLIEQDANPLRAAEGAMDHHPEIVKYLIDNYLDSLTRKS